MTNTTQRSIKRLSIAILIIGGITLAYLIWEMIAQLWVSSYIQAHLQISVSDMM